MNYFCYSGDYSKRMKNSENTIKYRQFCEVEKAIPLFLQAWWMDAVCKEKDSWDVLFYEESKIIKGVFVYYKTKKNGFQIIIQPQLTQYNGIWLKYDVEMTELKRLTFEKKSIGELISLFENTNYKYYNQNFHIGYKNWLPFYWKDYIQTTRYTYQINDISNPAECFEKFSYAKQKQIRKAEKSLFCHNEMSADEFYDHLVFYYKSKHETVLFSKDFFVRLHEACIKHNQGKIIAIKDNYNLIHAALFIVWDNERVYNLISSIHPDFKKSGGSTLVVYEAIKQMSQKVKVFDFEGSMDQRIENSFSQFGTEQVPYFNITKFNSFIFKTAYNLIKK